ncbi:hypothetical protein KC327_g16433 [Hortaea werneckii]|uniref:Uncharacterized protein n=1 Tax=Hortaea werneckii TaxID=91943 RepID=A0A3M7ID37_HORWE|nr:hypothetical protein KC327_g16433 [Hortaea werneckii]RMZ23302.1 hypothetical protein D0859_12661 [Hortaea werneckii]
MRLCCYVLTFYPLDVARGKVSPNFYTPLTVPSSNRKTRSETYDTCTRQFTTGQCGYQPATATAFALILLKLQDTIRCTMTGTGYTVASSAQLLGSKAPKRREAPSSYSNRMAEIDTQHRETSALRQRDHVRTIRFIEPSATPAADREGASGENGGQGRASSSNANFSDNTLPATFYTPAAEHTAYTGDILSAKAAQKKVDLAELAAVRPQELRPAATLPAKHTDRIARTTGVGALARIDTSGTLPSIPSINVNDTSGLSRSASKASRRNSQVAEFYFSPIQVNSRIGFSDPIPSPQDDKDDGDDEDDEVLTPTQARYDEQVQADKGPQNDHPMLPSPRSCRSGRPERSGPKIILTAAQVDRLVKALAESPLLTCHVKRQWWDESSEDDRSVSEGTPSLSSGSGSGSTALYSQENKAFLSEPRSPSTSQAILEEEFAQNFPDHPKAKHPAQHAAAAVRTTKFGGIALVDPKVHGTPIRFVTEGYRLGANVLQVGACTFMNIPYGTTVQSNLRVEPPSNVSGNARVMLQVVNQVLERKTGKKTYLLVAELDVTESMTKAALTELAAAAEIPLPLIQIATPTEKDRDSEIDWCALADEFEVSCQVASIVELAAGFFPKLTAETCSMQTLTLMSELERIKTQHQDFFILKPTGYHRNGMFSGVNVPSTSQHLDLTLFDSDPNRGVSGEADKAARALRDRVVSAVAEGCAKGKPFNTRVWWGDQMRQVRCVPLLESAVDDMPALWIAFLSGQYSFLTCPAVPLD